MAQNDDVFSIREEFVLFNYVVTPETQYERLIYVLGEYMLCEEYSEVILPLVKRI